MPRANWKGYLKIAELTCPVALYTAASTSDRIAFHTLNRSTGHRVRRQYIDSETGKPVETEDQVKGYEVGNDDYVVLEPDEVASAVPASDKTLLIDVLSNPMALMMFIWTSPIICHRLTRPRWKSSI